MNENFAVGVLCSKKCNVYPNAAFMKNSIWYCDSNSIMATVPSSWILFLRAKIYLSTSSSKLRKFLAEKAP